LFNDSGVTRFFEFERFFATWAGNIVHGLYPFVTVISFDVQRVEL
jgi:hypothetical protein